jgi:hypothetical protein
MSSTITPQIVIVDATVTEAPAPSGFQQSGTLVSFGGSTLSSGTSQYCGNLAAVTAILSSAGNHAEIANMAGTFFAQGGAVGVSVLELGIQASVPTQITDLQTWITANPGVFYAFLVPAAWDTANSAGVQTMAATFGSVTGKTYFFVTSSHSTVTAYTTKAIIATVPSPTAAGTEFQAAALFYQWLSNTPAIASPAPPMNLRFVFGVTPWGINDPQATDILTAFGNVIITGSEGGISNTLLTKGTTMDGNQAMFWYAVDWIQINAKLRLANATINGSQPGTQNPLYYNQFGINSLLGVLQNLGSDGISIGLLLAATFTATPFATYTSANPSDYAAGIYKGFACTATPQLGFTQITFFLDATTFA